MSLAIFNANLPNHWYKSSEIYLPVQENRKDWKKVCRKFPCGFQIDKIVKVQNKLKYNQFLLRQQFLDITNTKWNVYRVLFFVGIYEEDLNTALTTNLDPRLLDYISFNRKVTFDMDHYDYILITQVLTTDLHKYNNEHPTDCYIHYYVKI